MAVPLNRIFNSDGTIFELGLKADLQEEITSPIYSPLGGCKIRFGEEFRGL